MYIILWSFIISKLLVSISPPCSWVDGGSGWVGGIEKELIPDISQHEGLILSSDKESLQWITTYNRMSLLYSLPARRCQSICPYVCPHVYTLLCHPWLHLKNSEQSQWEEKDYLHFMEVILSHKKITGVAWSHLRDICTLKFGVIQTFPAQMYTALVTTQHLIYCASKLQE